MGDAIPPALIVDGTDHDLDAADWPLAPATPEGLRVSDPGGEPEQPSVPDT